MPDLDQGITEPEVLRVQWLEEGLLVHGVTLAAAGPPLRQAHGLAVAALAGLLAGVGAAAAGWWIAGGVLGAAGLGAALALGRLGVLQARAQAVPASPRRLLVELGRDRLSWTSLAGDRWSMRHDHEVALTDVVEATPGTSPEGATLRVTLTGAADWEVPLHGVPASDVSWLAQRITEASAAAKQAPAGA
jgi:hypothetical protein